MPKGLSASLYPPRACKSCGKVFVPKRNTAQCCCQKCADRYRKALTRAENRKDLQSWQRDPSKAKKTKRGGTKQPDNSINAIVSAAVAAGMSYGQYQLRRWLAENDTGRA